MQHFDAAYYNSVAHNMLNTLRHPVVIKKLTKPLFPTIQSVYVSVHHNPMMYAYGESKVHFALRLNSLSVGSTSCV